MEFEKILEQIGSFGWFQKRLIVIVFFAGIPNVFVILHFAFTHHTPEFHCKLPQPVLHELEKNLSTYEEMLNLTIPFETDDFGNVRRSQCTIYKRNYSQLYNFEPEDTNTTVCQNGWHFYIEPDEETVVTKFNLVCSDSWKTNMVVSVIIAGKALAACFGYLADRYGRRPVFLITTFGQLIAFAISSLSFTFTFYVICLIVTGVFSIVNYLCAFVLAAELTDIKKRNFIAFAPFLSFSIGYIANAGVGYFFRKWSTFIIAASVISSYQIIFYWVFPESVRWLIMAGKMEEAKKQISIIAKDNGKTVDVDQLFREIEEQNSKRGVTESDRKSNILKLFKSPARGRFFSIYFGWLCTSLIYYAISIFSREFSSNRFLNGLYAGIADLCGCLAAYFLNIAIGRPRTMCLCMLVIGMSSFLIVAIPRDFSFAISFVALAGKCMVSGVYFIIYVIATELAPTLERNSSLSMSSFSARLGGVIAPYIMLLDRVKYYLPYIVMGTLSLISGILAITFIPETKGVALPETIADVESNQRFVASSLDR